MDYTAETKLADILAEHPWLKRELPRIDGRFKMLQTPVGSIMLKTVTVADMSKRSGIPAGALLAELDKLIAAHGA